MFMLSVVSACPMCNADGKDISIPIIGTFLFVPYIIFLVALFTFKKLLKQARAIQDITQEVV